MAKINKLFQSSKKNIEIVVAIALCALLLVIFFVTSEPSQGGATLSQYYDQVEHDIENLIMDVNGVRNASATVRYSQGVEQVFAYETTTKNNGDIVEELVLVQGQPVLIKEVAPKVESVVVVIKGNTDAVTKLYVKKIVTTLLNIDSSKIEVLAFEN